ncbi:hypothetical protein [Tropicibacter alexandrii]|uniref:hypothetical protein n=1 Tax=Tropicibacter alexandrii TaxID=2267683 RepID=UPI0013E8E36A|nr:hypothetical protein [Tropicibacter alexandrii]
MLLRLPKLIHLPRAEDLLNSLLPAWPVMRTAQDQDPWNPETHEDRRLTTPED